MGKKRIFISLIIVGVFVGLWMFKNYSTGLGINPHDLSRVVKDNDLNKFSYGTSEKTWGFYDKDVDNKDFSKVSLKTMASVTFNETTKWPENNKLPEEFIPLTWLEKAKNPGLKLREIHKQGITGKGVSIAIFDKPILWQHEEFEDRVIYNVIDKETKLHFHGMDCLSYLAGKTCGVAPESKIYYFAVPDKGKNFYYYSLAMDELIKINKSLPETEKIRLVSISDGIMEDNKDYEMWEKALKRGKDAGIRVLYSNVLQDFIWGGCPPYKDKDDLNNYKLASCFKPTKHLKSLIIVPADFKTSASNEGKNKYTYWSEGGFSSSIPYLSGLSALALQVNPAITLDEILDYMKKTKYVNKKGFSVLNPKAFLEEIKKNL